MIPFQAAVIAIFILVHLFGGKLQFLDVIPRSRWLSLAGGISVAYVFVHILPELVRAQESIGAKWQNVLRAEKHAYIMALIGLALFYGLERMVKASQRGRGQKGRSEKARKGETTTTIGVFWLHISSFSLYNILIAYLLAHRQERDLRGLIFFGIAMTLHFLVTDFGLRQDHRNTYKRLGRWLLMAAIVAGWIAGLFIIIGEAATALLFAFLAGGVILNVLKEELPEERQSRYWPFAFGAGGYALLLLFV